VTKTGTSALLVVDIQKDFCAGGALAAPGGDEIIPAVNRHIADARSRDMPVYATRDWHPPATSHFKEYGGVWPPHCVQGTHGAKLHAGLAHGRITEVFPKGTDRSIDSYSGFYDNARKKQTGLADWLRERWITRLYVMGLATDYCVKATVLDARELGFDVWVIEDGCRAVELAAGDGERAFAAMRQAGATLVESGTIGP